MVCCLWVLMTQETHRQIDIAQISPVSLLFQCWNTQSWLFAKMSRPEPSPQCDTTDSVYYTVYTSSSLQTVNLPGKKENICSTKTQSLNCLPGFVWPAVPESRTLAASFFQPHLILFSTLPVLMGEIPARLFPSLFLWWEVYRGSVDKNKLSCIILSCLVISVLLGGF